MDANVKRIIDSCENKLTLETCIKWANYIYKGDELSEVLGYIGQKIDNLCNDNSVHQMD
jgi:hypothetical protein